MERLVSILQDTNSAISPVKKYKHGLYKFNNFFW